MVFASIANLTNGKLISAGSVSGTLMTVAFQATLTPVPEISALFPIIGLVAAVAVTQVLRRRRIAQVRAASLDAN
jgi:beta-lactamase regulating signal transducer with metallopeptidase domain